MVTRRMLAVIVGTSLLAAAGLTAATGAMFPRSIWGDGNPGQGPNHAAFPEAGREHNNAGATHTDNRGGSGDHENETGGGDDDDENETGGHDGNETHGDDDENETEEGDDEGPTEAAFEVATAYREIQSFSPTRDQNNTDGNWSRNWSRGNLTCSGSGNRTSGEITCSWPAGSFTRGNLSCNWSAGSVTVKWDRSAGTWSKEWSGGGLSCSWTGGRHGSDDGSADSG